MISPIGFISISELESEAKKAKIKGYQRSDFHNFLKSIEKLFVTDNSGKVVRIPKDTLTRDIGEGEFDYAFIDRSLWTISLDKVRETHWGNGGNDLKVGMAVLSHGLEIRVSLSLGKELLPFEGKAVFVAEEEETRLKSEMKSLPSPQYSKPAKIYNTAELEQAFNIFLQDTPNQRPSEFERNTWAKAHGESRRRVRKLWDKFKPVDGSKPGPK